jgi:dipeptidyl aminopeptidase/acylaminoacyl peptidase
VDSIRGDWGGKPYQDCIAAVDYVLAKYQYLDPERMGALGASYGGYMVNWINGHTEKFKVLVNHDGIFSLKGLFYSTEEIWFPEWEFGAPFVSTEQYDKWSPDNFIKDWKTPTLVIHGTTSLLCCIVKSLLSLSYLCNYLGSTDFRVCETEGISTFTALQR